jgi:hypothetical protein
VARTYWRASPDRIEIAADLRSLLGGALRPDPVGVLGFLLHGTAIPPRTLFEEIRVFTPGLRTEIDLDSLAVRTSPSWRWEEPPLTGKSPSLPEQAALVRSALRDALGAAPADKSPLVLFSGGIDSTAIALTLLEMGKRPRLAHFAFDARHPDTLAAVAIARRLGLPLDTIEPRPQDFASFIENAPRRYRTAFADASSLPTNQLIETVLEHHSDAAVFDGTGADGAFGMTGRGQLFRQIGGLPRPLHRAAGVAYRSAGLWAHPSRVEPRLRLLHRALWLPPLSAAIAQQSLLDVVLDVNGTHLEAVAGSLRSWVRELGVDPDSDRGLPTGDVGLVCGGIFSQKTFSPLRDRGIEPRYPFLESPLLQLGIAHATHWQPRRGPKAALRHMVETTLGADLFARAKSGFIPERDPGLTQDAFLDAFVRGAAAMPGLRFRPTAVARMVDRMQRGLAVPTVLRNLAWSTAVCDAWLAAAATR